MPALQELSLENIILNLYIIPSEVHNEMIGVISYLPPTGTDIP